MKPKSLLLATVFSFALTPFAMAESLYHQAINAAKEGNVKQAAELHVQACNAGDARGCSAFAYMLELNKLYPQAAKLYEQSCNVGNALGCDRLAWFYYEGMGVKQNYTKAIKLAKKNCLNPSTKDDTDIISSSESCALMGLAYLEGKGVRQSDATAKEYFGKACDLGDQRGCDTYKKLNIAGY